MDDLIGLVVMLSLPGYLVLQWYVNLWPLLLILAAPFACLFLLALAGARAIST